MAATSTVPVVRLTVAHRSWAPGADQVGPSEVPGPEIAAGAALFLVGDCADGPLAHTVIDLTTGHPWVVVLDEYTAV